MPALKGQSRKKEAEPETRKHPSCPECSECYEMKRVMAHGSVTLTGNSSPSVPFRMWHCCSLYMLMTFCLIFSENCLFAADHDAAFERILFSGATVSFPRGFAFGNKPRSSSQVRTVYPSPRGLRSVLILEKKSFEAQTCLLQHLMV